MKWPPGSHRVQPEIFRGLIWVKGRYESVRGPITTEWHRESNQFTMTISIPANTMAKVFVLARKVEDVDLWWRDCEIGEYKILEFG
jgi:hypothetical protein